jgi:phosphoglycerate dehydrogenase-like enzyme
MRRAAIVACEPLRPAFVDAFRGFADVVYEPEAWREEERVARLAAGADVLLTRNLTPVSRAVLGRSPRLGCVAVYGAGREHLDMAALRERNLHLIRCSREVAGTIAEFTLGLALALLRRIPEAMTEVRAGTWDHNRLVGTDLAGKRVLVVGCGPIGCRTALLFARAGARVAVARKRPKPLPALLRRAGCRPGSLESGLPRSHLVSLHVSGGESTRNLIGAAEIGRMRRGSYLINTARGSVVDFPAVIAALESGRLAGAALDVLPEEPPRGPLPEHPRLWITPHLALYSEEAIARRIGSVVRQVRRWWERQPTLDQ